MAFTSLFLDKIKELLLGAVHLMLLQKPGKAVFITCLVDLAHKGFVLHCFVVKFFNGHNKPLSMSHTYHIMLRHLHGVLAAVRHNKVYREEIRIVSVRAFANVRADYRANKFLVSG